MLYKKQQYKCKNDCFIVNSHLLNWQNTNITVQFVKDMKFLANTLKVRLPFHSFTRFVRF